MMKLFSILPLLLFFSLQVSAQNQNDTSKISIEKSIYGIQAGFLGTWLYNESRLSNEFVLRSQVGFDFRIEGVSQFESAGPNDDFLRHITHKSGTQMVLQFREANEKGKNHRSK